ncbi:hypothetical protein NW801_13220 [Brevibacillus laterosporus]|uniref:Uncharacterized protein n=1 Tax=Brevibacillus halotolerans TaxID=1507437 RepID=A0ABT4HY56_9BACL|nr:MULTISPECIES: hypothetical protein [Brevibacillus]MCR8985982.1 hypothetical protein [Brevibacillus laterosporus]MCZ0831715.1 hypothetical protein [Brevibacillus halotolerans]
MNLGVKFSKKKASTYVLEDVRGSFFPGVKRWLTLNQLDYIKNQLIQYHTKSELRTLKACINSQVEKRKQFPIGVLMTVCFTTVFSFLVGIFIVILNTTTSLISLVASKDLISKEELNDFINKEASKVIFKALKTNMATYFEIFGFVLLLALGILVWYYWRLGVLLKISYIIEESIEEKTE